MSNPTASLEQYAGIVSSLPNISLDTTEELLPTNLANHFADFIDPHDLYLLRLVYMPIDHANLLNTLYQTQQPFLPDGNFSASQIKQIAAGKLTPYPYIEEFILQHWQHHASAQPYALTEIQLTQDYFFFLLQYPNTFLQKWAKFTLELRNFSLMQYVPHGLPDLSEHLVAPEYTAYLTGKYRAKAEQESLVPLAQLTEIWTHENPLHREKLLDTLIWQFLQSESFFYYFSIERIIAHAFQRQLANRWAHLNRQSAKPPLLEDILQKAFFAPTS
ncbi:MAG TPA: DUF2764 family protein [Chitinophagales bacterium]|nr:DUF2764 family protein [Chitinophagales bacterium]HRK28775.1 DUF2764 family protein [Chitinophagales bacterium]